MAQNRNLSWLELCELASKEQDPKKLIELITEIEQLLSAEEERVRPVPRIPNHLEAAEPNGNGDKPSKAASRES